MFNMKVRQLIALTATATLFFCQNALATTTMDSIGTGSAGSYNHGELKGDSSKSKTMHYHISGSGDHHISGNAVHHRSEGSNSKKSYSHQDKKGYSHKKSEGSQSKSYSYGKYGHGKKSHAFKGRYGKSYGHKKSEGSQSKSYSYGKYGHGKKSHAFKGRYGKSHGHNKGSHGGHGKSPFKHVMAYKFKLGLTDMQINKMKELDLEFKKKIIQAKADHEIAHMELDLQVHSGKVDEAKIRTAGAKIVASKTNKIIAMIDAKIQLLNLLTADQRHKMAKMH
jgi:Spy/CpxP family protein refolding chaperone